MFYQRETGDGDLVPEALGLSCGWWAAGPLHVLEQNSIITNLKQSQKTFLDLFKHKMSHFFARCFSGLKVLSASCVPSRVSELASPWQVKWKIDG